MKEISFDSNIFIHEGKKKLSLEISFKKGERVKDGGKMKEMDRLTNKQQAHFT